MKMKINLVIIFFLYFYQYIDLFLIYRLEMKIKFINQEEIFVRISEGIDG